MTAVSQKKSIKDRRLWVKPMPYLALLFLVALGASPARAAGWLAFGDLRGNIAPCGCDPLTDLGGLERLANMVGLERTLAPELALFSPGANLSSPTDAAKDLAILQTTAALKPTAVLFNLREQKQQPLLVHLSLTIPWVLSNSREALPRGVKEVVSSKEFVIFGFIEAEGLKPWDAVLEKTWQAMINQRSKAAVLLFAGSDRTLASIIKSRLFSTIISANTQPADAKPTEVEKSEPGRLLRQGEVYMVPAFGQGVLRGGSLRSTPSLLDNKGASPSSRCKPGARCENGPLLLKSGDKLFTWLDHTYKGKSSIAEIIARYEEGAKAKFQERAQRRQADLEDSPYAGAETCKTCHAQAFTTWSRSKHALALPTLKEQAKDQDPECVSCHVVAYEKQGGYVSETDSPWLAGVQCENCHGPRKAHSQNPTLKGPPANAATCAGCHNPTHSPQFDFAKYWLRIKHGKEN